MADMMDVAVKGKDASFAAVSKGMVISAYERPRFRTPENQKTAAIDFQNDIYLQCIKSAE